MVVPKIATMVMAALSLRSGMESDHARANVFPIQRQQEQDGDIGEQAEGQHHQEARIAAIGNE